jgi:hypothetical protein
LDSELLAPNGAARAYPVWRKVISDGAIE